AYNPLNLDWTQTTVEGFDKVTNQAILVFNFSLNRKNGYGNAVQFIVGKILAVIKNFPIGVNLKLIFDIRGQDMILSRTDKFKSSILGILGINKINNNVIFEF